MNKELKKRRAGMKIEMKIEMRGLSSNGRATDSRSVGQWFKSSSPHFLREKEREIERNREKKEQRKKREKEKE